MKSLSTIDALAEAIDLVRLLHAGHDPVRFEERLQACEEARDRHRRQDLADQVRRNEIRRLAEARRA